MNRNIFLAGLLSCAVAAGISSCKKEKEKTEEPESSAITEIRATVRDGNSYNNSVDSVKVVTYVWDTDPKYSTPVVVAGGKYENGGFRIALPASVKAEYLYSRDFPEGVSVSNPAVKTAEVYLHGYKNGERTVFSFWYENDGTDVEYHYADRDAIITGAAPPYDDKGNTGQNTYAISYKKGWNMVYRVKTQSGKEYTYHHTTTPQTGLEWFANDH
ncbi:MAG: hypothetical protein LBR08_02090 [Bacteroidales bacterium]|nr:hypothetical protein [Bacteroidales bacterium]